MAMKIPGPQGLPLIGNLLNILADDSESQLGSLEHFADVYGPIYQFTVVGQRRIVCSSSELLAELIDEKRFVKIPPAITTGTEAKGLFTARHDDPDWGQAHRILMPAFGPLAVEGMFDGMKDIANQLILKWARQGSESRILATDDFTRLTLDAIALCAMDYRFNSFYQDEMHPFVDAMLNVLAENGARTTRPAVVTQLMVRNNAKFKKNQQHMQKTTDEIIAYRRAHPKEEKDLLNSMLYDVDPKTGKPMRDELITAQMKTFLVAGHETTSGLLSFLFLYLCKNSHAYLKAQKEVDDVVGRGPVRLQHLKKLKYLNAVIRETSRLSPTAPVIQKMINPNSGHPTETLGGGKYVVNRDDLVLVLLSKSQRDVSIFGEDASEFKPERMMDEEFDKLPSAAWKPFGNGTRACIGRAFAWQEALLATALILQNFDFQLDDPAYKLRIKQTLTVKPKDLYIRATLRPGIDPTKLDQTLHGSMEASRLVDPKSQINGLTNGVMPSAAGDMTILFGSNTGTCQAFAQRLASDASARGFAPHVMDMNSGVGKLPKETPVIIITSSYEGQPPDNASRFIEWLQSSDRSDMEDVQFAVFGCGHRDWTQTFHRVPNLTDELLAKRGAKRIAPKGLTDIAKGNVFGDFEDWLDNVLWPGIAPRLRGPTDEPTTDADISTQARASSLRHDVSLGKVKSIIKLTQGTEPAKWHVEIQLPSDTTYECGDYLAVLPLNPDKLVRRIMSHFQLPWDAVITLKTAGQSTIPSGVPLSIYDVLRSYVELSQPATKKDLKRCALYAAERDEKCHLDQLCSDAALFETEILTKRTSLFDVLARHASAALPFADFLVALPPMRVRQYSISSSPLDKPAVCTLTFGVVDAPALSDNATLFEGVASTYLSGLAAGDTVQVSVRPTAKKTFRLPADGGTAVAATTPLLMFCAGTGLAPFRGFVQQRAVQMASSGRTFAPALLFVGCRSPTTDRLYASELDEYVRLGAVDVRYAFSRSPHASDGCAHVADRMRRDRDDLVRLWRAGARVYVCGSRAFAESVRDAARAIAADVAEEEDVPEELKERFRNAMQERIATDIFD